MIQRLQSVFLFLTIVLSVLFLSGSILNFVSGSGEQIKVTAMGIFKTVNGSSEMTGSSLLFLILLVLLPAVSLITIFLFKNRNIQLKMAGVVIALSVILIGGCAYYSYLVRANFDGTLVSEIKMVLPLLILIFAVLAYRGIKKDDKLVKSYDRLR